MQFVDLQTQYQHYQSEIDQAVLDVFKRGDFILGKDVGLFEREVAAYLQTKYAISCANGTDALNLALLALEIGPGDEVIVPSFTFIATASQVAMRKAKPVFVDIHPRTFNLTAQTIESAITAKTKAVIVVHLFGQPVDLAAIKKICQKHRIALIEDCAQAFGATYKDKAVGTWGDIGCFSFFPAKNLGAYGDAGMITTQKKSLAEKITKLRFHGHQRKYYSVFLGLNSRLDTVQAAVLRVKLKHFDRELKHRQTAAAYYTQHLSSIKQVAVPIDQKNSRHADNYYTLSAKYRNRLQSFLEQKRIPTMVYYPLPCHLQPAFKYLGYKTRDLPHSEHACRTALSLPLDGFITPKDQDTVISAIKSFYLKE